MIEILGLRKAYGEQKVLQGIDLKVDREIVGVLGANGSGKTTLLKCVLGLLDFEGTVRVSGIDIRQDAVGAHRKIGYIPQYLPLWGEMQVGEAIRFFSELREVPDARGRQLLEEFGLASHAGKRIGALSGGMRQKLSIAIALLPDPEVMLLDEPTASLDAWATREILSIMKGWKGRKTVLLSSHRLEEIQAVADRLERIQDGALLREKEGRDEELALGGAARVP